jgi:hypothetical protein
VVLGFITLTSSSLSVDARERPRFIGPTSHDLNIMSVLTNNTIMGVLHSASKNKMRQTFFREDEHDGPKG